MIDFLLNATILQGELFKAKQGQEILVSQGYSYCLPPPINTLPLK